MKLRIISKKSKPFQSDDGEAITYHWYKAVRTSDDMLIEFGSMDGSHEVGGELELDVVKVERADGKAGYKELVKQA